MATTAFRAVGAAVSAVLVADATLAALLATKVYAPAEPAVLNDIGDGQEYPLILLDHASEVPWHTFGGASSGLGWKLALRIHVYSRTPSDLQAIRILERVVEVLNFQTLTVPGYSTVIVHYERGRVLVEDVEKVKTRHIPAEFTVMVHQ